MSGFWSRSEGILYTTHQGRRKERGRHTRERNLPRNSGKDGDHAADDEAEGHAQVEDADEHDLRPGGKTQDSCQKPRPGWQKALPRVELGKFFASGGESPPAAPAAGRPSVDVGGNSA